MCSIALHNVQKADITGANIHGPAAAGEIAPSIVVINHTLFTPKAGQRDRVLEISVSKHFITLFDRVLLEQYLDKDIFDMRYR